MAIFWLTKCQEIYRKYKVTLTSFITLTASSQINTHFCCCRARIINCTYKKGVKRKAKREKEGDL